MKKRYSKLLICIIAVLLLSLSALVGGCTNLTPVEPQSPPRTVTPPAGQTQGSDFVVTYNYGDTDKVQLSANNLMMKVGQRLILSPAPGLTQTTRFTSSGENFWGDIMKQEAAPPDSVQTIFTAIKAGKGKLLVVPNGTDVNRAVELWATVE